MFKRSMWKFVELFIEKKYVLFHIDCKNSVLDSFLRRLLYHDFLQIMLLVLLGLVLQ